MKRRLVLAVAGAASAVLMLSACSGGTSAPVDTWVDSPSKPATSEPSSDDGVYEVSDPARPELGFGEVEITDRSGETRVVPNESEELAAQRAAEERRAAEEESRNSTKVDPQYVPPVPSVPSKTNLPAAGGFSSGDVNQAAGTVEVVWDTMSKQAGELPAGGKIDTRRLGAYLSANGVKSLSRLISPTATITGVDAARALTATSTCVATWTIDGEDLGRPDGGSLGYCFFTPTGPKPSFKVDSVTSAGPNALSLRVSTTRPVYWLNGEQRPVLFSTSTWVLKKNPTSGSWLVDSVSAVNGGVRF
jgi:hypothetical protein